MRPWKILVAGALRERSVVNRMLAAHLPGRFCLKVNGQTVAWPGDCARALEGVADPVRAFHRLQPTRQTGPFASVIRKDPAASVADGGAAVGLQTEQKRSVHIHSEAHLRADGLKEIAVQCMQPPGSRFVFLSDEAESAGGQGRAPCGLTYLSAGIAFCFMTQLGRYAQIRKMQLHNYRIVQKTSFGNGGSMSPVETAVFLDSDDSPENNLLMVQMGEQTCYLHTTLREPVDVSFSIGRD